MLDGNHLQTASPIGQADCLTVRLSLLQIPAFSVVPEGQLVTLYENTERQGRKSCPLYEGPYNVLTFLGFGEISKSATCTSRRLARLDARW
ncbi:MAG: hypothetical protein F4Y63_11315 [Chloroflexi bacterium]|nr:hypothetical protein [Chloroflexota bacterium]MYF80133.1 hypothetical protein [Chloroflexota bacterium]